jgi:TRAP-type transport system small permease protein
MNAAIARLSTLYGRLLDALVFVACLLLLLMTVMIGADVASRNAGAGIAASNELSEDILYLMTLLAAPWLLRQGQHIRVDIVLRALPARVAWLLEWVGDMVGLFCCLYFVWYGCLITRASYLAGSVNIKTLVTPEWWTLAPLPVGFALLGIEFIFRMHRLSAAPACVRDDAVSAA